MQTTTTYTAVDCSVPAVTDKDKIIALLYAWVSQRPGLEFENYGDVSSYRAEMRGITHDLHDARILLAYVERVGITAERLREAFSAFSGRLSLVASDKGMRLDYCTGQYWPTEYRKAACAVLASAIWDYTRCECMPEPTIGADGHRLYRGITGGAFIRKAARREFGSRLANRWFN